MLEFTPSDENEDDYCDGNDDGPGFPPTHLPQSPDCCEKHDNQHKPCLACALDCGRQAVEDGLRQQVVVDRFPLSSAGAPVEELQGSATNNAYGNTIPFTASNLYAPFISQMDWEVARWVKLRGPGSTAASELLSTDGVCSSIYMIYPSLIQL